MSHRINRPRIADENIEGEVIVIDFDSGCYYSMSDMGSLVWDLIDRGVGSDDVVRIITNRYGDSAGEASESISKFINELEREGLIVSSEDHGKPDPPEIGAPEFPSEFSAPKLEKFTDMQDLLLLDPIHEVNEAGWPRKK